MEFIIRKAQASDVAGIMSVMEEARRNTLNPEWFQGRMLEAAEKLLDKNRFYYLMCTIHPDNKFSRHNMESHGYEVKKTAFCYGGLPRCILLKSLE